MVAGVVLLAACARKDAPAPAPATADCGALTGDNAVQIEMRRLECALQQVVAAIGRDDLAAVPESMHVVHAAKEQTEEALHSGAYKLPRGDLAGFAAMDEAFHATLEALVEAPRSGDYGATARALRNNLAHCSGATRIFELTNRIPRGLRWIRTLQTEFRVPPGFSRYQWPRSKTTMLFHRLETIILLPRLVPLKPNHVV